MSSVDSTANIRMPPAGPAWRWPVWFVLFAVFPPAALLWLLFDRTWRRPVRVAGSVVSALWTAGWLHFVVGVSLDFSGDTSSWRLVLRNPWVESWRFARAQRAVRGPAAAAVARPVPERGSAATQLLWPEFRGPGRTGMVTSPPTLPPWPREGLPLVWKTSVGGGYASMVLGLGRLYTIEQRGYEEAVTCYDALTGEELWAYRYRARFEEALGGPGPRATPTLTADGRLYALGAEGHLSCLDARTGRLLWQRHILEDSGGENLRWGMAGSPLVLDDLVIVTPGGPGNWLLAAYDRYSGELRWHNGDDQPGYSSPLVATLAGQQQIVLFSATRVGGYALEDGRPLWSYPWRTQQGINVHQPIVFPDGRVFVSSDYGVGCAMLKVSRQENGTFQVEELWRNRWLKAKFSSSVVHNGYLYGLDGPIMACLELATGKRMWKGGRYGFGQLILVGDSVIVLTERGELVQVAASPERHHELARFQAIEGKTWNHPAYANGRLYVRNDREMACYLLTDLPAQRSEP